MLFPGLNKQTQNTHWQAKPFSIHYLLTSDLHTHTQYIFRPATDSFNSTSENFGFLNQGSNHKLFFIFFCNWIVIKVFSRVFWLRLAHLICCFTLLSVNFIQFLLIAVLISFFIWFWLERCNLYMLCWFFVLEIA